MAWSEYDQPSGTGKLLFSVQFKGGSGFNGTMDVFGTELPTDTQYQAVIDALNASELVQVATITMTNEVSRTMTYTGSGS